MASVDEVVKSACTRLGSDDVDFAKHLADYALELATRCERKRLDLAGQGEVPAAFAESSTRILTLAVEALNLRDRMNDVLGQIGLNAENAGEARGKLRELRSLRADADHVKERLELAARGSQRVAGERRCGRGRTRRPPMGAVK